MQSYSIFNSRRFVGAVACVLVTGSVALFCWMVSKPTGFKSIATEEWITSVVLPPHSDKLFVVAPKRGVLWFSRELEREGAIDSGFMDTGVVACNAKGTVVYIANSGLNTQGRVAAFDIASNVKIWDRQVIDGMITSIALSIDDQALWIVGHDGLSDYGWGGNCTVVDTSTGRVLNRFLLDTAMPYHIAVRDQEAVVFLRNSKLIRLQYSENHDELVTISQPEYLATEINGSGSNHDVIYAWSAKEHRFLKLYWKNLQKVTPVTFSSTDGVGWIVVEDDKHIWIRTNSHIKRLVIADNEAIETHAVRIQCRRFALRGDILVGVNGEHLLFRCLPDGVK